MYEYRPYPQFFLPYGSSTHSIYGEIPTKRQIRVGYEKNAIFDQYFAIRLSVHTTGVVNPVRPLQVVDNGNYCSLFTALDGVPASMS